MTERKQERKRRLRGMELLKDLIVTQQGFVLISPMHIRCFQYLGQDPNFIYRAEMAEALSQIKMKPQTSPGPSPNRKSESPKNEQFEYLSADMFQASYSEEIQYFINDNDTLVRLKGITTCAKLMCHKLIQTTYF